jgi:C4-dicarboxylate-specific signal transduction histidine kinase
VGGLTAGGFTVGLAFSILYVRGILPSPFSGQLMLLLILVMGYELSTDVLRAGQLSRELLQSQQRMRLAASAADLSLWEWNIVRDEIWVTEKGRERAGVGATERINFDRFLQAIHPEDHEPTQRAVRRALEGRGEFEAEYRVLAADGAIRWVEALGQVERDPAGKPLRLRGVAVDVTERKQAEKDLQRLQGELAHFSRVSTVGQLSNTLAHELNQPLAIILTNAQAAQRLLAQEPPDLAETREILTDIVSADEQAGEVIKRLRALLKPGQTPMRPLSANALVEDVLRIARSDLIERGIKVHAELNGSALPVVGDRVQLQQVLLNLILNAGEAMAANPPSDRHMTIAATHRDGTVRVSVTDTGCGLPPNAERVFEPFYTTKKEGLGLGLQICRSIVTAHNGRLWAEPNVGVGIPSAAGGASRGTTFHVELPAAVEVNP